MTDIVIIGGGPAGLAAARAAASAGARTVVLERAEHPRYKTCGGGLIGTSLGIATRGLPEVPARDTISAITFTLDGRLAFTRRADRPLITLVRRDDFDDAWHHAAVAAGAEVRQNAQVRAIEQDATGVTVTLADGSVMRARLAIGADGSAGITSRHVGVAFAQQDLGLEVELAATEADRAEWRGRVLLDWGPVPGSYGWVFPKDDELTVGVIMAKGQGAATKDYLAAFVTRLGLDGRKVVRDSGHLTRCRTVDSPLGRGRVLVAGDAAGLVEPWTREGISYALRSGTWAGQAAARAVAAARAIQTAAGASSAGSGSAGSEDGAALREYAAMVRAQLVPEMKAGRRMLEIYMRRPRVVHAAMATPMGWRAFESFCRGELSMANVLHRPGIKAAVTLLG